MAKKSVVNEGQGCEKANKYENSLSTDIRKQNGVYYTPKFVVDYIFENTICEHDIVENPCPKIIDLSCGCGNFLLKVYDVLKNLILVNLDILSEKYDEKYWIKENVHNHIINNCIYGSDLDKDAINILKERLNLKSNLPDANIKKNENIVCCDSLKHNWGMKFDYVFGNPPYVGHKKLDLNYKKFLKEEYSDVYIDKSDIYFCFFKKISDILKDDGISGIITPRYFLESESAKPLRRFLEKNVFIYECIDFLGMKVFKSIGISSCILFLSKRYYPISKVKFRRIVDENVNIKNVDKLGDFINNKNFKYMHIKKIFNEDWIIVDSESEKIYNSILDRCEYRIGDIVDSFQGIITGCDKAFVYKKDDKRLKEIEDTYIKNWIKAKNLSKFVLTKSDYKLIYANDIKCNKDLDKFKNIIDEFKIKLENRRECKKNLRRWYQLQWGRDSSKFEQKKIMYPYKSIENRFAIDYGFSFSSADVYSFIIRDEYKKAFSYEYIVAILNSKVYDRYYKIMAKKMSKGIFDYYPNKVLDIKIFKDNNYNKIEMISNMIIKEKLKFDVCDGVYLQCLYDELENVISSSLGFSSS